MSLEEIYAMMRFGLLGFWNGAKLPFQFCICILVYLCIIIINVYIAMFFVPGIFYIVTNLFAI